MEFLRRSNGIGPFMKSTNTRGCHIVRYAVSEVEWMGECIAQSGEPSKTSKYIRKKNTKILLQMNRTKVIRKIKHPRAYNTENLKITV